jgi:Na+-transporting methylmalonyl-CoA/oxaloacetate decarboxylase gamma subunit
MTDKIMAILALATMIAFLGTVVVFVPDVDLIVVIAFVSALATYDFWRTFRERRTGKGDQ